MPADGLYVLADFDDAAVGVVKAYRPLAPLMLHHRVDVPNAFHSPDPVNEGVEVVFLEIEFPVLPAEGDFVG